MTGAPEIDWLTEGGLGAIYGAPSVAAIAKVAHHITPDYAAFIERARFCVLASVGPEGTDASPRGDDGPVAAILDPLHLALPDRRGNDRIDSLRNIVRDGRVSAMFMVRGAGNVIRINGTARLTADAELCARFARDGKLPRTVAVIRVDEVYFQCARAVIRAGVWSGQDDSAGLPTPGVMLAAMTKDVAGGEEYDRVWPTRAAATLW